MPHSRNFIRNAMICGAMILALSGCSTVSQVLLEPGDTPPSARPNTDNRKPSSIAALPGWHQENHLAAVETLRLACPKLIKAEPQQTYLENLYRDRLTADNWRRICENARDVQSPAAAAYFLEQNFESMPILDFGKDTGLITGYYEAELNGSYRRSDKYRYPLYRMPDDQHLKLTRAQIDAGALSNRNLELLWIDDPVSIFTLHVQGSGRVRLDDGRVIRVGFAGKNKHPYYSIGKTFGERKLLPSDKIDMDAIENYLRANPQQAAEIMQTNPSYIFFRNIGDLTADNTGPIGALGIPLVPERSIAVDRSFYPLGIPLWIDVDHPDPQKPAIQKMVYAFDTGSAIKGTIRADYFFGAGKDAKYYAGQMRGRGKLYAILPRPPVAVTSR